MAQSSSSSTLPVGVSPSAQQLSLLLSKCSQRDSLRQWPEELLRPTLLNFQRSAIELSELRASPKQRAFYAAFENRRDPITNKKVDVFVALGGNRSGKSVACGWLCFSRYIRDKAKEG